MWSGKTALALSSLVVLVSVGTSPADVVFSDNFDSYPNQTSFEAIWPKIGAYSAEWTNEASCTPPYSVKTNATLTGTYRNYHNLGGNYMPSDERPLRMSFCMVDAPGGVRHYNELRDYAGGGYEQGSLAQLYAIGVYHTVTVPGEVYDATKYSARVAFGSNSGWFNLNAPGAPNRTPGWHRFTIEVKSSEVNFYVDGILGRTWPRGTITPFDCVVMGSGLTNPASDPCYTDCFLIEQAPEPGPPKNVIFMIGDGMGLNHVKAAGMYLNGAAGTLSFEWFPSQGQVTTYSASSSITDSAAAGTAMATGNKVNNGVISMAYPGDGHEYQTLLEWYKARGTRTGLVTSDAMTGATPAAFGAHDPDRNNTSGIASDYLNQTKPNILLGGGGNGMSSSAATAAGYFVVSDQAAMQAVDTNTVSLLSGQFGTGSMPYEYDGIGNLPHLREMIVTALDILDNDPDGFFLLVEGGNIDHAAHSNDLIRDIYEVDEFSKTVQNAISWAAGRTDTLIVVTADHETGGMSDPINNGQGVLPTVTWSTGGHTGTNVGVWAWGVNAQYITGTLNNTQFFKIITNPQPTIAIDPPGISKRTTWAHNLPPNTDSFALSNTGLGSYNYTITSDATWVWADPASGSCSTETDTIWLVYDVTSLTPGPYVAHLDVISGEASNSPVTFTVNLTVDSVPGDFDSDSDVDQADFGHLQACMSGLEPAPPVCEDADLDRSGQINQADVGVFQGCLSGPGNQADPHCAD